MKLFILIISAIIFTSTAIYTGSRAAERENKSLFRIMMGIDDGVHYTKKEKKLFFIAALLMALSITYYVM